MFSCVELNTDGRGYLNGMLFSDRNDAMARIHILSPESKNNRGSLFRAFLNSGFIGEYDTEREAVDAVLFLANVRYAAGNLRMQ